MMKAQVRGVQTSGGRRQDVPGVTIGTGRAPGLAASRAPGRLATESAPRPCVAVPIQDRDGRPERRVEQETP